MSTRSVLERARRALTRLGATSGSSTGIALGGATWQQSIEAMPAVAVALDTSGTVVVGRATRQALGLPPSGQVLDGRLWQALRSWQHAAGGAVDVDPVDDAEQLLRRALDGTDGDLEVRNPTLTPVVPVVPARPERHGRIMLAARAVRDPAGVVAAAVLTGHDTAELRQATLELAKFQRHAEATAAVVRAVLTRNDGPGAIVRAAQAITSAATAALFQPDGHGDLVCTSSTTEALLGLRMPLAELSATATCFTTGRPIWVDGLPDARVDSVTVQHVSAGLGVPLQYGVWYPIISGTQCLGVLVLACAAGAEPPIRAKAMLEHLAAETALALAHEQVVVELERLSGSDPLTGAGNRRTWEMALSRELPRALRTHQPLSLLMIDLDHFKAYNDTHGHSGGDDLLRQAVHAWNGRLRPQDLLCRWGGEEFAVLLPGCGRANAVTRADDLRTAMPAGSTCSIGVAEWNRHESHYDFITRADTALYAAKADGRDRVQASAAPEAAPAASSVGPHP